MRHKFSSVPDLVARLLRLRMQWQTHHRSHVFSGTMTFQKFSASGQVSEGIALQKRDSSPGWKFKVPWRVLVWVSGHVLAPGFHACPCCRDTGASPKRNDKTRMVGCQDRPFIILYLLGLTQAIPHSLPRLANVQQAVKEAELVPFMADPLILLHGLPMVHLGIFVPQDASCLSSCSSEWPIWQALPLIVGSVWRVFRGPACPESASASRHGHRGFVPGAVAPLTLNF